MPNSCLKREFKSLSVLYAPRHSPNTTRLTASDPEIRQRCERLGAMLPPDARTDEEQEREVSRELGREREVERRPPDVTS